jgi:hypothetical protein
MASIIPFPTATLIDQPIAELTARLRLLESVESADETVMDTVSDEQQRVLASVIATPARGLTDIESKLATLLRRAAAQDGMLDTAELALLASSLADVQQLAAARAFG